MKTDIVAYQDTLNRRILAAKESRMPVEPIRVVARNTVYEIEPRWVDFVDPVPVMTKLPQTDGFILGTCHSRGRVLVALDLALALGSKSESKKTKLIAFKGRDLALCASLATQSEIDQFEKVNFGAHVLGSGARYFSHLS